MKNSIKIEQYLKQLERALEPLSIGEKVTIISEVKADILSSLEQNPNANIDIILSQKGDARSVAQRYLRDRGLVLAPEKRSTAQWMVIGCLGSLAIAASFVLIVMWKFTPVWEVDEETGKITLFGGAIDLDELDSNVHFNSFEIDESGVAKITVQGAKSISSQSKLDIQFENGQFVLENSNEKQLRWECEIQNGIGQRYMRESADEIQFSFIDSDIANCRIFAPKDFQISMNGSNVKIEIKNASFPVKLEAENGKVDISPGENSRYELSVSRGSIDEFVSSPKEDSRLIHISLENGLIKKTQ